MWPMDEYAIRRLMFFWPIAANDPSAIEAMETNTTICCHSGTMPGNAVSATRVNTAKAATFGADAKNAVTASARPHIRPASTCGTARRKS